MKAQLEKIGKSVEAANKKLREARAIKGLKDHSEAAKLTAEVLQVPRSPCDLHFISL